MRNLALSWSRSKYWNVGMERVSGEIDGRSI